MDKIVPEMSPTDARPTTKDSSISKEKTSWFKFPKFSFSSPWRKEHNTDGQKQASSEITVVSAEPDKLCSETTEVTSQGHDNLLHLSTNKAAVCEDAANIAAVNDFGQMVAKCKNIDVISAEMDAKNSSYVVTSTARTELALLESDDSTLNVKSSKARKMPLPEGSHQGQDQTNETSTGIFQTSLIESEVTTSFKEHQNIDSQRIFQGPDLPIYTILPENLTIINPEEHCTSITKEYRNQEHAVSELSGLVSATKELSSFPTDFHFTRSECTESVEDHLFSSKYTKTEETVHVLTENTKVQEAAVPETAAAEESSTVFQRNKEKNQSEQK